MATQVGIEIPPTSAGVTLPVSIANGGTGAVTVAAARAALGVTADGYTAPAAVAGYTTVGAGATWADFSSTATGLTGFKGTMTNLAGNNLNAKAVTIPAGDFAVKWWCLSITGGFTSFASFGLEFGAPATNAKRGVFGIKDVAGTIRNVIDLYVSLVLYGSNPYAVDTGGYSFGARIWFGVGRAGTTLSHYLANTHPDVDARLVTTTNDSTGVGLDATVTEIGPVFEPNNATAGTTIMVCYSAPAP